MGDDAREGSTLDAPGETAPLGRIKHRLKLLAGTIASVAAVGAVASGLLGYWSVWKAVQSEVHDRNAPRVVASPAPAVMEARPLSVGVRKFRGLGTNDTALADSVQSALASDLSQVMGVTAVYAATQGGAIATTRPVQYFLEVDLQSEGATIRANVRLLGGADGAQVWGDRFAIEAPDAFKAQDLVAARLSNILAFHLVRLEGERLAKRSVDGMTAEELSLLGRAALHKFRTRDTLHEAQRFFDAALAKNSDLVEALVGNCLALGFEALGFQSSDTPEKTKAALAHGERAIRVAPALADAHMALGQVYQLTNRLTDAGAEEESAIAINPNLSQSYVILSSARFREGRYDESIAAGLHQMQINPNDPQALLGPLHIGNSYAGLKRYPEAIKWLLLMRTRNPYYWRTQIALASSYSLNGEKEKAADALQDAVRSYPAMSIKFYVGYLRSGVPAFSEYIDRMAGSLREIGLKED